MRLFLIALAVVYAVLMLFAQTLSLGGENRSEPMSEKTANAAFPEKPALSAEPGQVENAGLRCEQANADSVAEECDTP